MMIPAREKATMTSRHSNEAACYRHWRDFCTRAKAAKKNNEQTVHAVGLPVLFISPFSNNAPLNTVKVTLASAKKLELPRGNKAVLLLSAEQFIGSLCRLCSITVDLERLPESGAACK